MLEAEALTSLRHPIRLKLLEECFLPVGYKVERPTDSVNFGIKFLMACSAL